MHFNSDKFECMRLWPRQSTTPDFKYLGPDGNTIEVKESMKDFGVNITSDLYSPSCKDCGECLKAGRLGTPYI